MTHRVTRELGRLCPAALLLGILISVVTVVALLCNSVQERSSRQLANVAFVNRDQLLALVDEETGVRGYIATNNSLFLEIYSKGIEQYERDASARHKSSNFGPESDLEARKDVAERQISVYFREQVRLVTTGRRGEAIGRLTLGKSLVDSYRIEEALLQVAIANTLTTSRTDATATEHIFELFATAATLIFLLIGIRFALLQRIGAQIERYAARDQLTGIGNRRTLFQSIEDEITGSRLGNTFAVALIDLDGFKLINDTLGHAAGDDVLRNVAGQLKSQLRSGDSVARLGGDEFALVLKGVHTPQSTTAVLARLRRAIETPCTTCNRVVTVGGSIGLRFYPIDGLDAVSLLKAADRAMYSTKRDREAERGSSRTDLGHLRLAHERLEQA